jgi:uncharacterized protein YjiS (DUF1127 family)
MNAPIAKDQFGFSLGSLTYIDSTYDSDAPRSIVAVQKHAVREWLGRLLATVTEWQRRHAVMQEMAMMTDHELSDIGLSRADLARVFDPTFAADHSRGRDYIAY